MSVDSDFFEIHQISTKHQKSFRNKWLENRIKYKQQ